MTGMKMLTSAFSRLPPTSMESSCGLAKANKRRMDAPGFVMQGTKEQLWPCSSAQALANTMQHM